jgi:restriction system protein
VKLLRRLDAVTDRALAPIEKLVANLGAGGILLLTAAVYVLIGIVLPLAVGGSRVELILLGAAGATWAWGITLAWTWARVEVRDRRHLLEWTTELRHLDAEEFEWLVGELLRREGWQVEETGKHGAPDGNIDLRARRNGTIRLVQCKCWKRKRVGVDEVRELGGTLLREGLTGNDGTLVTLSRFNAQAVAEASDLGIELLDGPALLERLAKVRRTQPCPACGAPMILSKSDHGWWMRCPRYPECKGKQHLGPEPGRAAELLLIS